MPFVDLRVSSRKLYFIPGAEKTKIICFVFSTAS